jgi:hypothetical protein
MSWKCRKGWHTHAGPGSEPVTFLEGDIKPGAVFFIDRLADHLGQVRQNQQQRSGEKNEPGLTYFRLFEHGLTAFIVIS